MCKRISASVADHISAKNQANFGLSLTLMDTLFARSGGTDLHCKSLTEDSEHTCVAYG